MTAAKNGLLRRRTDKAGDAGSKSCQSSPSGSWDVVDVDSLPQFLRDNEFLLSGHRPQLHSIVECCRSAFRIHTETCNIWTHLLGCVGTILLAVYYLTFVTSDWLHGVTFSVFFSGAIFCLGASTIFHMLICHSEEMCILMAKIDYCGVIALIVSSFIPWVYFGFYCHDSTIKLMYMSSAVCLGSLCIWFVLQDKFREPRFRTIRADGQIFGCHDWLIFMAILYLSGGVIYAMRLPERLWPGKFDIWCQSHQILHICVVGGVVACYNGASKLANHRLSLGAQVCNTTSS
ncbi:hypothetical protein LSH36_249g00039 [Paralvinella palmiformis]|uniref:Uncharacterized protein n=1 Tax=Paralvinella palmiformis TaxID=53620 RepID=A0AAD9JKX5_9ANNE|nr:hypothetical protein LSH36_249g00039 [Paralvinella palmiformis]